MVSPWVYAALVAVIGLERLLELRIANRNAERAFAQGGKEFGQRHYVVMKLLHTGFLVACVAEVLLLDRPFHWELALPMGLLVCATMGLRYWVISTLGERWNTRVIVVPGLAPVEGGPYRWIRHPNYVAVVIELAALPLLHGAWLTALVFSLANLLLLRTRIRVEEEALRSLLQYQNLDERPRFLPGGPP